MLFTFAHALGSYYFSSFKSDRNALRLLPELLLYVVVVTLAFAPVLDGNNWLYGATLVLFHIVTAPLVFLVMRKLKSGKARSVFFLSFEAFRLLGFATMAFFHSVRWGAFEPWREVRFFLVECGLDYNQVLAWAFSLTLLLRPANVITRSVIHSLYHEEGEEERKTSGWAVGIIERIFYLSTIFYGSWIVFGLVFFAKCALFAFVIRSDGESGIRIYTGSLVSALTVIPVALIASAFF